MSSYKRLVYQLSPTKNNPRNSEGSFLRAKNGDILFAYSRYNGTSDHDHSSCDIALIRSSDEGESWSYDGIIAYAKDFNAKNLMSVSALVQSDTSLAFYFLIKENDKTGTVGRIVSKDGINFFPEDSERCDFRAKKGYYVINNDRISRLSDSRIIFPAAYYPTQECSVPAKATLLISEDDGKTIIDSGFYLESNYTVNSRTGLQEPGAIETDDGIYMWFRTRYGCQYESKCKGLNFQFSPPIPSIFTSPCSPMQIKRFDGVYYAVYNPIPNYDGRIFYKGTAGRSPIVIRKSIDFVNWGDLTVIEGNDERRGYCYPAIFKTNDNCLLLAYCRGDEFLDGGILDNTGIVKLKIDSIQ